MTTQTIDTDKILISIDEVAAQLLELMLPLDANAINTVPYEYSWTAAQLFTHVSKSVSGIAGAMAMEGKPAERDAGERIPELKKIFHDFSIKMKSPDFIVPAKGPYEKGAVTDELKKSFLRFEKSTENANLTDLVSGLPLGPITKLELLNFVLFHSQRHLHQMRKICDALK